MHSTEKTWLDREREKEEAGAEKEKENMDGSDLSRELRGCHIENVGGSDGGQVVFIATALTHHDYFSY